MNKKTLELNLLSLLIGLVFIMVSVLYSQYRGVEEFSYIEITAVFTSYVCTMLCVLQSRSNYIWGIISVLFYCKLFMANGLFASAATQIYLCGALIYGWLRWGPDKDTRPVRFTPIKLYPIYIGVTLAVWLGAITVTSYFGGTIPPLDSAILALTILAQFLLDNKRIETWVIWFAMDIVALYLYFDMPLVFVQYIVFTVNTVFGAWAWHRSMVNKLYV